MSAVPLAEFKAHVNITGSSNDAELQRILDAAEAWVSAYIGQALGVSSRTFTRTVPGTVLLLPVTGLSGITSVTRSDGAVFVGFGTAPFGGSGASGTPVAYTVDLQAGIVYLPSSSPGPWTVVAEFPATVPADIKLAVLIIAAHLWETQRGESPSPMALQDGEFSDAAVQGVGYAIPNRARALLDPHVTPVTA